MKSLFITGGRGLIGKSIVRDAEGNGSFSRIVTLGRSDPEVGETGSVYHEVGSIHDETVIRELMARHETTHLVHAAGARTKECGEDPGFAYESNIRGTDLLFQSARQLASLEKAVFISTAAVYGGLGCDQFSENSPIAPQSNYAITKAAAEMAVFRHLPRSVVVRPGFTIGSKPSKLNQFTQQALTNDILRVIFASRFFVHSAEDVGRAIVRLLLSEEDGIFHLPGYSLRLEEYGQLLQRLAEKSGFEPAIELETDHSMSVPGVLTFERFSDRFPDFSYQDLESIFLSIINS